MRIEILIYFLVISHVLHITLHICRYGMYIEYVYIMCQPIYTIRNDKTNS